MCSNKLNCLKSCSKFPYSLRKKLKKKLAFPLEFVSLHKKNNPILLLLLNKCKVSYFITSGCVNLRLMGLKNNQGGGGVKPAMSLEWWSVAASVR